VVGVIAKADNTIGIGQISARFRGQNKNEGRLLVGFMQTASNFLDKRITDLESRLLAYVQTLSLAEIDALPVALVRPAEQSEVRLSRKSFQQSLEKDPRHSRFSSDSGPDKPKI
jgi:hypothetical protein